MTELKLYVTLSIPENYFTDNELHKTYVWIQRELEAIAEGLEGSVIDVEIK